MKTEEEKIFKRKDKRQCEMNSKVKRVWGLWIWSKSLAGTNEINGMGASRIHLPNGAWRTQQTCRMTAGSVLECVFHVSV